MSSELIPAAGIFGVFSIVFFPMAIIQDGMASRDVDPTQGLTQGLTQLLDGSAVVWRPINESSATHFQGAIDIKEWFPENATATGCWKDSPEHCGTM